MDFGLLLAFRNPRQWARPLTDLYREHIEQAVLAEELGYDHVWTTEHHFAEDAWSPSLLPILSAIATRTSRIRLGTSLSSCPCTTRCGWRRILPPWTLSLAVAWTRRRLAARWSCLPRK